MKIIALGDTHGRTIWKSIVTKEPFDKVVFIGDYFDTHEDISAGQQKDNFRDIIQYKEANKDKVVLLFGNHDFHYLSAMDQQYSGFNRFHAIEIEELLLAALDNDYLQMCFIYEQFLFVHAGVTKTWCRNTLGKDHFENGKVLEQTINDLFRSKPNKFGFTPGRRYDPYGDEVEQSPVWVRPDSLFIDRLDSFTQIVGHTVQEKLIPFSDVTLIDTLGTSGEYLCIVDGEMQVKNGYGF
jgi:hypothetical protein